jgi:hypothetical protein
MQTARITIDVPADFRNIVKSNASLAGKKLKDYIIEALDDKIRKEKLSDDQFCINLAKIGEDSGYIGKEASKKLLDDISTC